MVQGKGNGLNAFFKKRAKDGGKDTEAKDEDMPDIPLRLVEVDEGEDEDDADGPLLGEKEIDLDFSINRLEI